MLDDAVIIPNASAGTGCCCPAWTASSDGVAAGVWVEELRDKAGVEDSDATRDPPTTPPRAPTLEGYNEARSKCGD